MVKKLALLFSFALALSAQQLALTAGAAYFSPGGTYTVSVVLTGTQGNLAAVQDRITVTPTPTSQTVTANAAVNKKANVCVSGNPATCIMFGVVPDPVLVQGQFTIAPGAVFNSDVIPDGTKIQDIVLSIPPTVTPGSAVIIKVDNVFASDASGSAVALTGSSITIPVTTTALLVQSALNTWSSNPTLANFIALIQSLIAAQLALGK